MATSDCVVRCSVCLLFVCLNCDGAGELVCGQVVCDDCPHDDCEKCHPKEGD